MDVFRRRDDRAAGGRRDRDATTSLRAVYSTHARSSEDAATKARENLVSCANTLDRSLGSVGHRDAGTGDEALIRVSHDHEVAVFLGQELQQHVLRVVRVLV